MKDIHEVITKRLDENAIAPSKNNKMFRSNKLEKQNS